MVRPHSMRLLNGCSVQMGQIRWIQYISKKRSEELLPNDSDDVRVAMTYEHNGRIKNLEKMFHFTKSFDGEVSTSNYSFSLIEGNGVERVNQGRCAFDKDVPSSETAGRIRENYTINLLDDMWILLGFAEYC